MSQEATLMLLHVLLLLLLRVLFLSEPTLVASADSLLCRLETEPKALLERRRAMLRTVDTSTEFDETIEGPEVASCGGVGGN